MDDRGRKPLLRGRGVVALDELCRLAGVDEDAVASLIESGRLPGLVTQTGQAWGLFEDELPSGDDLRALGVTPDPGYHPGNRAPGHGPDGDDGDGGTGAAPDWHMGSS